MLSPANSPPPTSPVRSAKNSLSDDEDDDSLELSFDYEVDADGKLVRVSKGSSKPRQSAPPTPPKTSELPAISENPAGTSSARRSSLSRSESMPGGGMNIGSSFDALLAPPRVLSRTSSGPITIASPAQSSRPIAAAPLSGGLQGANRKIGGAQRIRKEEVDRQRREIEDRMRREAEETERERARRALEEKENEQVETRPSPPQSNRQIASLPSRQGYYSFPRVGRSLVTAKKLPSISKIAEVELSETDGEELDNQGQQHYQRRSGSDPNIDPHPYIPTSRSLPSQYAPLPVPRPNSMHAGTTASTTKARRVTIEERMRQEQEIAEEEALAAETAEMQLRRSPSPPQEPLQGNYQQPYSRAALHRRRDSDTLRSGMPDQQYERRDETGLDQPPQRTSPSTRSLGGTTVVQTNTRTRRSPTSADMQNRNSTYSDRGEQHVNSNGKSHGLGNSQRAPSHTTQQPQIALESKVRNLVVSKKIYARLDMIGKGGSSRVYRVMNSANEIFAIKRVSLEKTDDETLNGYLNEISLLKRLEGNARIIRLLENELKPGPGGSKGHLLLLMECGEVDLARLLQEQQKEPMNMIWIAYYWQQILEAVQVIHDEKIVHSDLKPANFVLVKGQLKLIDFGIAKAIANDTTNIQRDHQIGTVNYMSPEAIEVPEGQRRLKVGRPSDVWSLGCILYQMVYGHPPFQQLSVFQKMKAIPDDTYVIHFPDMAVPSIPAPRNASGAAPAPAQLLTHLGRPVRRDVIRTMKNCLVRIPKDRAAIPELLNDDWLNMKDPAPPPAPKPQPPKLKDDETIINPYYMRQLFQHAIRVAQEGRREFTEEEEIEEATRLVNELKQVTITTYHEQL